MPRVKCMTEAQREHLTRYDPRDEDLILAAIADRLEIAEAYDAGRISEAQYTAAMLRVMSALQQRANQRDQIVAAQQRAYWKEVGDSLQEAARNTPAPPVMQPPKAPTNVTCNTYGTTTSCRSW